MKISTIPQIYRHVNRWREILSVLSKYGLAGWLSRYEFEFAKDLFKDRDGHALARQSRESRIRMALTELGPTFIKLGQVLSTRPDLVGVALADELTKLQADVPADPPQEVRTTIEQELGRPVEMLFDEFQDEPLASASIGQVHAACLHDGRRVVVKVLHTGIVQRVEVDLEIMMGLAQLAEKLPELANFRPHAIVAEFQRVLSRELEFSREQRNIQEFRRVYQDDETVRIPEVYPELSTERVLTMEMLIGIKLADHAQLAAMGCDLREVARRGADLYLRMIFEEGFYHADPHPGNVLVMPGNVIGLLDFGMVGRIDEQLREDIEEMFLALTSGDATHLTTVIVRVGTPPLGLDFASLTIDVTDFVSHYANLPVDKLELGMMLNELTEIIRRYQIMLPARVAMLLKVFVMLEGTARLLDPHFSLLEVMKPHQRKMLMRRLSPKRQLKKVRRLYSELQHLAEVLPRRLLDLLQQVETGKFDVHLDHRGLEPSVNRLVAGMLASALFLGSSLLLSRQVLPIWGVSVPGLAGCIASVMMGLRVFWAIRKSGHLDRKK